MYTYYNNVMHFNTDLYLLYYLLHNFIINYSNNVFTKYIYLKRTHNFTT